MKKLFLLLSVISVILFSCENAQKEKDDSKLEEGAEEVAEAAEDANLAFNKKKDKLQADLLILQNKINDRIENSSEAIEEGMDDLKGESNDVESELEVLRLELKAKTKELENSTEDNIDELEMEVNELKEKIDQKLTEKANN